MRVLEVKYIEDYKLKILFGDGKTKIVDLENTVKHAKGIFLPLKDLDYFKQVSVDDCRLSICWPNGADICPDLLYDMGKEPKSQRKRSHFARRRKRRSRV